MIFKHKKRPCFFYYLLNNEFRNEQKETMEFYVKFKMIFKHKKRLCFFSYLLNKEFINEQKILMKFYFRIMIYASPWLRTFREARKFTQDSMFIASPCMRKQTCTALIEISRTRIGQQCTRTNLDLYICPCTALLETSRTLMGPQCTRTNLYLYIRPYIVKAFKSGFNTLHSTKPYNTITISSSETEYQVTTSKFISNNFNVYF